MTLSAGESSGLPALLILSEQREFVRGCLMCWLGKFCQELETISLADPEASLQPSSITRAAAVIIGVDALAHSDSWLYRQVSWLRSQRPDLPIMIIVDDESSAVIDVGSRLDLQGYIPTSSSLEVAAAAVRLVVAGGSYFPRPGVHEGRPKEPPSARTYPKLDLAKMAELTSREWAVLRLLGSGIANKAIAQRLGTSVSTVKAHVHHIIRKLNVRNRTEVALLAQFLQPRANEESGSSPGTGGHKNISPAFQPNRKDGTEADDKDFC